MFPDYNEIKLEMSKECFRKTPRSKNQISNYLTSMRKKNILKRKSNVYWIDGPGYDTSGKACTWYVQGPELKCLEPYWP